MKIKVGLIGFGRMGQMYWEEMQKSGRWDIAYICDTDPDSRELARNLSPSSRIISDEQEIFDDQGVEAVGLFALANSRKEQIEKAVRSNKHILTEKPIADTIDKEWEIVDLIEKYDRIAAVNLYLRNSWYHQAMKQFIDEGEIGELAILRICHMTPGLAPGEGHEYEGPAYHDCGMHYIDIARWYADSEYKTGMPKACGCGTTRTLGGYSATVRSRTASPSMSHKASSTDNSPETRLIMHIRTLSVQKVSCA